MDHPGGGTETALLIVDEAEPAAAGGMEGIVRRGEEGGAGCGGHELSEPAEVGSGVSRDGEGLDAIASSRLQTQS